MSPSAFDEENILLQPPEGVSSEDCAVISAFRGVNVAGQDVIVSCWKPSREELEEIRKTGRVWLVIWGTGMPPVALLGHKPFEEQTDG